MIFGKRLRLRAMERSDLPNFVIWLNDPEVTENLLAKYCFSTEDENRWFENMLKTPIAEHPLAIEVQQEPGWKLIGNVSLMDFSWQQRSAELGIMIGEKTEWDKGYGTEAICLMVNYAFTELNLHRVWLQVYETNLRGRKCYEKVGFQWEGTLRDAIFKHGKYVNIHVMSVLSSEWKIIGNL